MTWPVSAFPTSLDSITDKADVTDDVVAADVNGVYDCIEHIEAKLGVDGSAVATSIDYLLKNTASSNPGHKHTLANGATDVTATAAEVNATCQAASNAFFASGRKVWLYENTAPTGWTIVAAAADAVLAVKGGANAYNVSGGTQAGTWTQPDHAITTAEMASHDHGASDSHVHATNSRGVGYVTADPGSAVYAADANGTGNTGAGGGHTHSSVGSGTAHNHGTTYRPLAQVGIIVSRN